MGHFLFADSQIGRALSSRAIVSRGNAKKDGFGRLVAGLPHDAIVRKRVK